MSNAHGLLTQHLGFQELRLTLGDHSWGQEPKSSLPLSFGQCGAPQVLLEFSRGPVLSQESRLLLADFLEGLAQSFQLFQSQIAIRECPTAATAEILNFTDEAVIIFDLSGTIKNINSVAERIFGIEKEKVRGHHFSSLWPESNAQSGQAIWNRILREGQVRGAQAVLETYQGAELESEITAFVGRDQSGLPREVLGVFKDITQHKLMEDLLEGVHQATGTAIGNEYLRKLTQRLSRLLGVDYILVSRIDSNLVATTIAVAKEAQSIDNFSFPLPGTPCATVLETQECLTVDTGLRERFPASAFLQGLGMDSFIGIPAFGAEGEILGILVVLDRLPIVNSSLKKRILNLFAGRIGVELYRCEEATKSRQLSERLSLAVRAGRFGVWDWDIANDNLIWDDRMHEIFGVHKADFSNSVEDWKRCLHPDDLEDSIRGLEKVLEEKRDYIGEFRIIHPNGSVRNISASSLVFTNSQGIPTRLIGVNADITEQREAELARIRLQEQLGQAQKMESVGRLAGGMAHDLNNMLAVIIGNVDLAMVDFKDGKNISLDLEEIRGAAHRSADLIRQLLAFAREQTIKPVPLLLNAVVEKVFKMIERLMGAHITLLWEPGKNLWPVLADPTQLDQILMNLCINSRDAISGPGQIIVSTDNLIVSEELAQRSPGLKVGEFVKLVVRDNGCGMEAEVCQKVFEPFFTTKKMGEGTGLGMSTVYGIVKQNGGQIDIESRKGYGTTVTLLLPRSERQVSEHKYGKSTSLGGQETILVVEDQKSVLKVAKKMLENLGYKVHGVTNPLQALELVDKLGESINLLLTDVIMPEMNGRELAEKLQARIPELKCLFMSGFTGDVLSSKGVVDESLDFVSKPFSQTMLGEKVRAKLSN